MSNVIPFHVAPRKPRFPKTRALLNQIMHETRMKSLRHHALSESEKLSYVIARQVLSYLDEDEGGKS